MPSKVRSNVCHVGRKGRSRLAWTALTGVAFVALAVPSSGVGASALTERVSVSSTGAQGDGDSSGDALPAISGDGRYVVFDSLATNLVAGDTDRYRDVFVRDRELGTTQMVSVSSGGRRGNGNSSSPAISANGRFVAFASRADDLVPGDTSTLDVFVRDLKRHTTRKVSVSAHGHPGGGTSSSPAISADGRYVAFASQARLVSGDRNGKTLDVYVRDRKLHTTRRVSVSSTGHGGGGDFPAISANGRYVAFISDAHLVSGDAGRHRDVYVRDRKRHTTRLISVSSTGHSGNDDSGTAALSADGRFVAFGSFATNLVPGDTNGVVDVFVRDRKLHTTSRVSVSSTGIQGDFHSGEPAISRDGRYVAFDSLATSLVPADTNDRTDVFVRDRTLNDTRRVSVNTAGDQANDDTGLPAISADGRFVAFASLATNLVPGDTNGFLDVFARGPLP